MHLAGSVRRAVPGTPLAWCLPMAARPPTSAPAKAHTGTSMEEERLLLQTLSEDGHAQLDLTTVLEMSKAVSSEIVLDRLVERLVALAVEHAGAVRGLLIVPAAEEGLRIEAEAVAGSNRGDRAALSRSCVAHRASVVHSSARRAHAADRESRRDSGSESFRGGPLLRPRPLAIRALRAACASGRARGAPLSREWAHLTRVHACPRRASARAGFPGRHFTGECAPLQRATPHGPVPGRGAEAQSHGIVRVARRAGQYRLVR